MKILTTRIKYYHRIHCRSFYVCVNYSFPIQRKFAKQLPLLKVVPSLDYCLFPYTNVPYLLPPLASTILHYYMASIALWKVILIDFNMLAYFQWEKCLKA